MKIYLSGPIDGCSHEQVKGWRDYLKRKYPHHEYLDPVDLQGHFKTEPSWTIEKEKEQIRDSDVVLCYPWKPSSGTSMEAMYAFLCDHKPKIVIVSYPIDYLSPWMKHHSHYVAENFGHAMKWIEAQNDQALHPASDHGQDMVSDGV